MAGGTPAGAQIPVPRGDFVAAHSTLRKSRNVRSARIALRGRDAQACHLAGLDGGERPAGQIAGAQRDLSAHRIGERRRGTLYATCTMSLPVMYLNNSIDMCGPVPTPEEP